MKEMTEENFKCIKEDNSEEEWNKQWKRSKVIFDNFYEYLKSKGLNTNTAGKRTDQAAFFIMNYVFVYEDLDSALFVSGRTIRKFLGNWYIRKYLDPNMKTIRSFLRAISDFYTFLHEEKFIGEGDLEDIKDVCNDVGWFEMRLRTYFESDEKEFRKWLEEYNYDF